jgi:hypothetical protein
MIGKFPFFLSAATAIFLGLSAGAVTTSQNVDIIVSHGAPLTTFTFVNNTGNTLPAGSPVSFGQAFRYGDILPGTYPLIRDAATHVALPGQQWDAASTSSKNVDITVTHAGSPVQTLIPIIQPSGTVFQFLAGTGSANASVGKIVAAIFPPAPAFSGSWAITGGTGFGKFKINPATGDVSVCNTAPNCTDLPAGTYTIVSTVSQTGVTGSPASTTMTIQGVDPSDTTTLFLTVDNYYPVPGSTIHVTVRNTPNTLGSDYVQIQNPRGIYSNGNVLGLDYQEVGTTGTHNATLSLTVPNPPTDNYQFLSVILVPNDQGGSKATAITPIIMTAPSLPTALPTATNTLTPPFIPNQTITVCPSGCQYTELSLALIGLSNANIGGITDNVLITMQAGTYYDCTQFGNASPFTAPTSDRFWHLPQHLWIKGIGGNFAHFEGVSALLCNGKGTIVWWGGATDVITLDNLEISDWATNGPTAAFYLASGNATMRNDYLHDGEDCILSGNSPPLVDFVVQNLHIARCGGPDGPQHNAYFGDNANSVTWSNTLSEQVLVGHGIKSRSFSTTLTCNQFRGAQDAYYVDSEEIDCPEGRICTINNNTLVKGPGSHQQNQIGWMMDYESGPQPGHTWSLNLNNNTIIYDGVDFHWGVFIGPTSPSPGPSLMTSLPDTWTNNVFVGGPPPAAPMTPYASWSTGTSLGYPDTAQVTEVGSTYYATRAAAGITQTYPPPPGCSGTIGNLAIP